MAVIWLILVVLSNLSNINNWAIFLYASKFLHSREKIDNVNESELKYENIVKTDNLNPTILVTSYLLPTAH